MLTCSGAPMAHPTPTSTRRWTSGSLADAWGVRSAAEDGYRHVVVVGVGGRHLHRHVQRHLERHVVGPGPWISWSPTPPRVSPATPARRRSVGMELFAVPAGWERDEVEDVTEPSVRDEVEDVREPAGQTQQRRFGGPRSRARNPGTRDAKPQVRDVTRESVCDSPPMARTDRSWTMGPGW